MTQQEMPLWKSQWTCSLAVWVPRLIKRVSRSMSEYGVVLGAGHRTENWRTDTPVVEARGSSDTGSSVPTCTPRFGGCSPTRAPEQKCPGSVVHWHLLGNSQHAPHLKGTEKTCSRDTCFNGILHTYFCSQPFLFKHPIKIP